ncbi:MAG: hypothetical protein GX484_10695 [Chloroflexi bacterium]|nr:hypothetical protein [Chloroflexota bacterium]
MQAVRSRFNYLFRSTKGLVLVAIALIALVTAIWGTLSGPLAEMGVKDVTVRVLGMDLNPAEREGRIIILYHVIAQAVIAIEVYLITRIIPMKPGRQETINATITVGYITSLIFGLAFAYFGHNYIYHGLFIAGQTLVFFAGVMLLEALWPWQKAYHVTDRELSHWGNIDLERVAFFTMAVCTLISAVFGAVAGANFGNEFTAFLAEDVVRNPNKPILQRAVIGHLHIMLTLIAIAITLIIGRWFDFRGALHKIAMPLMIVGTIITSVGAWSVTWVSWAHTTIYVGSVGVMLAALMLVIFGWRKLINEQGGAGGSFGQKIRALLKDPLKFGPLWQMVFINFTVSGVGIFMAVKLDEIIRVWPWREERITLTGHWHILSGIIATIILMYYADMAGLKGWLRQWFGWAVIIGSDIAFAAVTVFSMKRLFISEETQQPLVNTTMILADFGLALVLVMLAALMIWRLADLFAARGRWQHELADERPELAEPAAPDEEPIDALRTAGGMTQ